MKNAKTGKEYMMRDFLKIGDFGKIFLDLNFSKPHYFQTVRPNTMKIFVNNLIELYFMKI